MLPVAVIRDQKSEIRSQRSEVRSQRSVETEYHFFKIRNGVGLLIIEPSILPTSATNSIKIVCCSVLMYPQSFAKSNEESVSLFSPSQSVSLLIKCASYLLLAQASLPRQIRFEPIFKKHFTIVGF